MTIAIIGSGRMGLRHANGVLSVKGIDEVILTDINPAALENARNSLASNPAAAKVSYILNKEFYESGKKADVVIMASTASNRLEDCKKIVACAPKYILMEKPLGQSLQEVEELITWFDGQKVKAFVNLNTRLYPSFIKLKNDIQTRPQFQGQANVTVSTGTLGIGANGIHYIDLMRFLFDADTIEIAASEVDETIIPSGRGPQFCDFGGWAVMNYKKNGTVKAIVHFSLSSQSTIIGTMNFTFPHARVIVDEFEQKRYNKYRKADSSMPIQRYAADYQPQEEEVFTSPDLVILTKFWLENLLEGKFVLPDLKQSLESHRAMFNWLSKSRTHKNIYPVT